MSSPSDRILAETIDSPWRELATLQGRLEACAYNLSRTAVQWPAARGSNPRGNSPGGEQ